MACRFIFSLYGFMRFGSMRVPLNGFRRRMPCLSMGIRSGCWGGVDWANGGCYHRRQCMSWLFSQALAGEYSAARCSDGEPFAPSKTTHTQRQCWCGDKTMGACPHSQYGMTFVRSTAALGEDLLMWFRGDFLARTSAPQASAQASWVSPRAWFSNCFASLARLGLDMCSSKTLPTYALKDLDESSKAWPAWGMTRGGVCSAIATRVARPSAPACGWLPRPTYQGNEFSPSMRRWPGHQRLREQLAQWMPRPTARLYGYNKGGGSGRVGKPRPSLETLIGIRLDVRELMMDWPIGWTALRPLAMDKWHVWLRSPGQS